MRLKLLFLLLLPVIVSAQSSDTTNVPDSSILIAIDVGTINTASSLWWTTNTIEFSDSSGTVAFKEEGKDWIVTDTASFVILVLKYLPDMLSRDDRNRQLLWAAQDILNYQRTDGTITNWRKWTEAVKKYRELLNKR